MVFFVPDYAYGHEMLRGFQRAGKEFGMETLADLRYPLGTSDYSSFFPRVQQLKPDFLCLFNFGRDLVNAIKQAHDFGIKQQTKIVTTLLLLARARLRARSPSKAWSADFVLLENRGLARRAPKHFNDLFRKAHGGAVPTDYGALGYAGVKSVLTAARNAKTDRHRKSGRRDGRPQVRLLQGRAVLPQVRSPVGTVDDHRSQSKPEATMSGTRTMCSTSSAIDSPSEKSAAQLPGARPQSVGV